jgi:outer membrane lipoprotein carrier protein LolA
MPWSSRSRVAAVLSARWARITLGGVVASLGALPALGAEPAAQAPVPAAAQPTAAVVPGPEPVDALLLVQQRLVPFRTLQGHFDQEKQIARIQRPLRSRGRFALLRGAGVLWQTEAPIQSLLTLTADTLTVVQNNQTIVSTPLAGQPALRFLGQSVFAVFMTDVQQIKDSFTLLGAHVPERPLPWSLSLRPRDAAVAQLMPEIRLTGAEQLQSIQILERGGDSTRIVLRDVDDHAPLSPEDARLLGRAAGNP